MYLYYRSREDGSKKKVVARGAGSRFGNSGADYTRVLCGGKAWASPQNPENKGSKVMITHLTHTCPDEINRFCRDRDQLKPFGCLIYDARLDGVICKSHYGRLIIRKLSTGF